jgi:TonB-linked SusC/RagA family outer membrane protein
MSKKLFSKWLLFSFVFLPCLIFAQQVKGSVTDKATSLPISGATILVKGTSNGQSTDFDGNYTINISEFPAVLVFSYLGYETKEVTVNGASTLNVQMDESAEALDEIVISGLGTSVKRANSANSIAVVKSEDLVGKTAQSTLDGALYGKIPGANLTASSGAPGGGFALRLRGITSINGNNQPLFIIDGVYVNNAEIPTGLRFASGANRGNEENSGNRLADLDPNDIERVEVLKGAAASVIYGQRASAGVVVITTKRGKSGKAKISFNQDFGVNTIINKIGQRDWTAASVESTFGAAEVPLFNQALANGGLIDYEDEIYGEQGFITDTKLNVSGGSENVKYYLGTSYRDEEGIIKNTGFDRFSLRANVDFKISDTFDASVSSNYVRSNSSRSFTGNENEGGLSYGYTLAFTRPWIDLNPDSNGNYPDNPNYTGNPLFVRDQAVNEDSNNRFIQSVKLSAKLINTEKDQLKVTFNGGVDYLGNETYVYVPETHQAQRGNQNGFIGVGKNNFTFFNHQLVAVWNHDAMGGDLGLTTQGGIVYVENQADLVFNQATQLIPNQTTLGQGAAQAITQTKSVVKDFGYFAQTEANYKDQLIGTLGIRFDKSTLNGDPNKFYAFPRAALAANLHNFDFWGSDAISQFKLRAAYGESGNSANFGATFTSLNQVSIGSNGGSSVGGLLGDAGIEPETSAELELGIDARVFDKVNVELTYYDRRVENLILSRTLPTSSGFGTETTNLADLKNTGIELALNVNAFEKENFVWNTGVNFWYNRSEVTRLDVPAFPQPGAGFGLGLGTFYIEQGSPVTQLVGNIGGAPTRVGDVEPDFQMSFNNSFTLFKNWDISFLLHWKKGGENLNLSRLLTDLGGLTPDLDTQVGQDRSALGFVATRFVEPAGYLRLREVGAYYRLPETAYNWLGKDISGVKLGVSARNLFTITDYSSYDPETSVNGGTGLSSGIEVTPFPSAKQFYFHLNVNF